MDGLLPEELQLTLEVLALGHGKDWNYTSPFASFAVSIQGFSFRATLIHYSINPAGHSKLFLRRMGISVFKLENFDCSDSIKATLTELVLQKKNIVFSGATGSGKTTPWSRIL